MPEPIILRELILTTRAGEERFCSQPMRPLTATELDSLFGPYLAPALRNDVEQNLAGLLQYLSTPKDPVTFFVGAGVSSPTPSRLPLARELISCIVQEFAKIAETATGPDSEILRGWTKIESRAKASLALEGLLGTIHDSVGTEAIELTSIYRLEEPERHFNETHDFLATWTLQKRWPIVTTNFDELIEAAYQARTGTSLTNCIAYEERHFSYECINRPGILKLHGTASVPSSIRTTFADIGARLQRNKTDILVDVVSASHGCIVGWEAADIDIRPVMLEAVPLAVSKGFDWFYITRPGDKRRTIDDYVAQKPDLVDLLNGGVKIIVAESKELFTMIYPLVFGAPVLTGIEVNVQATAEIVRPVVDRMLDRNQYCSWFVAGNILHQMGELDSALDVFSEAEENVRMVLYNLLLESGHAAFDANRGVTALRFIRGAADVKMRIDQESSLSDYGMLSQLLSPNWYRELKTNFNVKDFGFVVQQWCRFPFLRRRLAMKLRDWRSSADLTVRRDAEVRLALIKTEEITAIVRILEPKVCSWWVKPLRRYLRRQLSGVLKVHQECNFLHGQYSALRRRAQLWGCDDCARARRDLLEVRRICTSMRWRGALHRIEHLERTIQARCSKS